MDPFRERKRTTYPCPMAGLQPEDTSWEPWTKLKFDYNLENKVILEAHGDVRISNIQEETKEQTKEQEADAEQ